MKRNISSDGDKTLDIYGNTIGFLAPLRPYWHLMDIHQEKRQIICRVLHQWTNKRLLLPFGLNLMRLAPRRSYSFHPSSRVARVTTVTTADAGVTSTGASTPPYGQHEKVVPASAPDINDRKTGIGTNAYRVIQFLTDLSLSKDYSSKNGPVGKLRHVATTSIHPPGRDESSMIAH
eukprot:scaffold4901_cov105-Cylindrotheca_fusiformis.AAC.2